MKIEYLRSFPLLLLTLLSVSCGSGSPAKTTTPIPASCTPSTHPSFAYVLNQSNLGVNSTISSFTVNSCTGKLTATAPATIATGSDPEDMVVDPLGRFVYAANLVSNASDEATISMYTIDLHHGRFDPDRAGHGSNRILSARNRDRSFRALCLHGEQR
jgi:DNA-binding beta-propeller fold protein YncE